MIINEQEQKIIEWTRLKFGLAHYDLCRSSYSRRVTLFNETVYQFCMEWFPKEADIVEENLNPEGTAVITIDLQTNKVESAIFVEGATYAEHGVVFQQRDVESIIKWIEAETNLIYGRHFQLDSHNEEEYSFKGSYKGMDISPSGYIELKVNRDGDLIFYSIHGYFPTDEWVEEEEYTLTVEQVEKNALAQIRLIHDPSFEEEKIHAIYGIEEIYVTNDLSKTIPYEGFATGIGQVEVQEVLNWTEPLQTPFARKEMEWIEDISAKQAFTNEPSADTEPINESEVTAYIDVVQTFLRQVYPEYSGEWLLTSFNRDIGYIHANLIGSKKNSFVFQRKLKVFIDPLSLEVINYIDNQLLIDQFKSYDGPEEVVLSKKEAYEKIKEFIVLKPCYVYDFDTRKYILSAMIDSLYGVDANTGEVFLLADRK